MFDNICLSCVVTPTLWTMRKVRTSNDAALGVEGLEHVAAVLALELCSSLKM